MTTAVARACGLGGFGARPTSGFGNSVRLLIVRVSLFFRNIGAKSSPECWY